jgi:hypothetical protein
MKVGEYEAKNSQMPFAVTCYEYKYIYWSTLIGSWNPWVVCMGPNGRSFYVDSL